MNNTLRRSNCLLYKLPLELILLILSFCPFLFSFTHTIPDELIPPAQLLQFQLTNFLYFGNDVHSALHQIFRGRFRSEGCVDDFFNLLAFYKITIAGSIIIEAMHLFSMLINNVFFIAGDIDLYITYRKGKGKTNYFNFIQKLVTLFNKFGMICVQSSSAHYNENYCSQFSAIYKVITVTISANGPLWPLPGFKVQLIVLKRGITPSEAVRNFDMEHLRSGIVYFFNNDILSHKFFIIKHSANFLYTNTLSITFECF